MNERNIAASCRARLLNHARATKQDFNLVLTRYSLERLLYRLAISEHANQFLLKGALLFDLWFDVQHRPTRDADFLGFGPSDLRSLEETFEKICTIEVDDGVLFQADSVHAEEIPTRQTIQVSASRLSQHLMAQEVISRLMSASATW